MKKSYEENKLERLKGTIEWCLEKLDSSRENDVKFGIFYLQNLLERHEFTPKEFEVTNPLVEKSEELKKNLEKFKLQEINEEDMIGCIGEFIFALSREIRLQREKSTRLSRLIVTLEEMVENGDEFPEFISSEKLEEFLKTE